MISEWMKVMLEEISRKKTEAEQARMEAERRNGEQLRPDEQPRSDEQSAPAKSGARRRAR